MTRGTTIRLLLVVPLLAAGVVLGTPKAASAATVCGDTPSGSELLTGTIKDSVVVADGSLCGLLDATVRGGVTIGSGAILESNSDIRGSVNGVGIREVRLVAGVVRGSVTIVGATGIAEINGVEVRGNVAISGAGLAALGFSTVRGSATVNNNVEAQVFNTAIGANLTCAGNGAGSTFESNTVGGVNNCPAP